VDHLVDGISVIETMTGTMIGWMIGRSSVIGRCDSGSHMLM
jgi:hypothetical protein